MDTSEIYIKMCEKAEEIQQAKRKSGLVHGDYVYAEPHSVFTFFTGKVELFTGDSHLRYGLFGCIFIPRQDQLQEMVCGYPLSVFQLVDYILEHEDPDENKPAEQCADNPLLTDLHSMEQLWFAFVMKEKYNKIWAGNSWELEK